MKLTSLRSRKNEKGAALVEMALVLPILLLLVFGIIEFGWMLKNYQAVGQCAREGARSAALATAVSAVNSRINDTASNVYQLTPGKFTMRSIEYRTYVKDATGDGWTLSGGWQALSNQNQALSDASHYSQVRVTLVYQYDFITGSLFKFLNGGNSFMPLRQSVVMRKEG